MFCTKALPDLFQTDTGVELRKGDIYERDNAPYTGTSALDLANRSFDENEHSKTFQIYYVPRHCTPGSKPCIIVQPKVPGLFTVSVTPYTQFLQVILSQGAFLLPFKGWNNF